MYWRGWLIVGANLVESLHESGMFYFVLVSLISSDSILTKEDAEKSIETLSKLEKELEISELSTRMKNKYKKKIKECYEVLNSDLERFE